MCRPIIKSKTIVKKKAKKMFRPGTKALAAWAIGLGFALPLLSAK